MSPPSTPQQRLMRMNLFFLFAFLAVSGTLVFWGSLRSEGLAGREDNPRTVEAELRIQRGRILDVQDRVLVDNGGTAERVERLYLRPEAEPMLGYISLRYGESGIEEGYDAVLRGDLVSPLAMWWRDFSHTPQVGQDVRLALDVAWQAAAVEELQAAGVDSGALVLISIQDGGIRAMVSLPSYDPNQLDESFDQLVADERAPLLNRATQGLYQPGLVLQPFVLAAAVDAGLTSLEGTIVSADDLLLQELYDEIDSQRLLSIWEAFGFLDAPVLPIPVAEQDANGVPLSRRGEALVGQDELTVTPLQVVLALAALANGGERPFPQVVAAVANLQGEWEAVARTTAGETAVGRRAAEEVLAHLPRSERLIEYTALVISGPDDATNGWYLALAPASAPRYALVIVGEEMTSIDPLQQVGQSLLALILE